MGGIVVANVVGGVVAALLEQSKGFGVVAFDDEARAVCLGEGKHAVQPFDDARRVGGKVLDVQS